MGAASRPPAREAPTTNDLPFRFTAASDLNKAAAIDLFRVLFFIFYRLRFGFEDARFK
jgi:hypothetical protein